MPKRPPKGSLVIVYWVDAADHRAEWVPANEVRSIDVRMITVGVYLGVQKKDGTRHVMLAGTKELADGHVNTCSQVPLGCVTKIVELTEKPDGMA